MGKKKKIKAAAASLQAEKIAAASAPVIDQSPWYSLSRFSMQALLLVIIGFICFANSFKNQYALDDDVIILKNQYVQEGIAGLPKIFSSDALESFYKQYGGEQQLSGGRYRPLSIATFAIEQSLFDSTITDENAQLIGHPDARPPGKIAYERHVFNVVLYIISVLLLLYFLKTYIFKEQPLIAFLASLLFLIHPIHTEVVANIKSRDEIFSFLFFMLTFIGAFRYYDSKKKKDLYWTLFFYFMAFLSKEYAITILVLLPMLFYIVKKDTVSKSLVRTIPFLLLFLLYMGIRTTIIGTGNNVPSTELLNNPYLFASSSQKLATEIQILDRYVGLLFNPSVLSSDYSYNAIPYTDFGDGWVWLSILLHAGMIVAMVVLLRKRNIISFALAFYLLHLFLVSNLMFDLGATMGERLVFHSSLGFVIIIAIGLNFILEKIKSPEAKKIVLIGACSVLVFWCAAKDIQRNAEWKNNLSLSMADVQKIPNSAMLNGNAGKGLIDSSGQYGVKRQHEMLDSAVGYLKKAVSIHNKYVNGYLNLGFAYIMEQKLDSAKTYWDTAKAIFPLNPFLTNFYATLGSAYSNKGIDLLKTQPELAVEYFQKAVDCVPDNIDFLNNLGMGYYFVRKNPGEARVLWEKSLQIQPNNKVAVGGMALFNKPK